jgi:tetratricopeptide (TPR) repeat protein
MCKSVFLLSVVAVLTVGAPDWQAVRAQQTPVAQQKPAAEQSGGQKQAGAEQQPGAQRPPGEWQYDEQGGFIAPMEINAEVESDIRTLVVMAAVNMAGFDAETAGQPISPARTQLRKDLAAMDPELKARLAAYYKSHRRPGVEETADVLRYEALSLVMDQAPDFVIYQVAALPDDLRPLADFAPLVKEFFAKSGIRQVLGKYVRSADSYAALYRRPVGGAIFSTLNYFHTSPDTIISVESHVLDPKTGAQVSSVRSRTRYVFVIMDPLGPFGASMVRNDILNKRDDKSRRKVGDDYIVVIGPSRVAITDGLRELLIRFAIDPMLERHLKTSTEYKDQISKLVASVSGSEREYQSSVYLVMRESLAAAAEARMRRIWSGGPGQYSEDDAVFDLAAAYKHGAVLSFHFYDSLRGYEKVGIGFEDFLDQMLATTDFGLEAGRPKEFAPIVARVTEARAHMAHPVAGATGPEAGSAPDRDPEITEKVLLSDNLIRQRHFAEARPYLEAILAAQPNNARAIYGMAQVVNEMQSAAESDPKADENDKIQAQHDRLEQATKLYQRAIELASPQTERWLIQWSHVFLGRIMDFQDFRADALDEYGKAIALGDLPGGAYKEAMDGKEHPFGQK